MAYLPDGLAEVWAGLSLMAELTGAMRAVDLGENRCAIPKGLGGDADNQTERARERHREREVGSETTR